MKVRAALFTLSLITTAQAVPASSDIEQAATRSAEALNGVLRNCPASFAKIGTDSKKCVGSSGTVEQVRVKLSEALGVDLYGVWRSRDEQRSVFNWVKTAGGYVYLRLQADPDGRAQTLIYLDVPPEGSSPAGTAAAPAAPATQIGNVTLTPAPAGSPPPGHDPSHPASTTPATTPTPASTAKPAETPKPQPAPTVEAEVKVSAPPALEKPAPPATATTPSTPVTPATPSVRSLAPVPFSRTLQLQSKRMNGPDVLAVQNRLIALMRPARSGQGDGWYGPVTSAAVKAFQATNQLPVTGKVDQATWQALFSANARTFTPPSTP